MKPSIWILIVTLTCSSFIISEANPVVKQSAFRLYTTDSDPNTLYLTTLLDDSSEESSEEHGSKEDSSEESIEDNNVEGNSSEEMGLHRHLMRHEDPQPEDPHRPHSSREDPRGPHPSREDPRGPHSSREDPHDPRGEDLHLPREDPHDPRGEDLHLPREDPNRSIDLKAMHFHRFPHHF